MYNNPQRGGNGMDYLEHIQRVIDYIEKKFCFLKREMPAVRIPPETRGRLCMATSLCQLN